MAVDDARSRFIDIAKTFDVAMLVTRAGDGRLHARPMAVADLRPDGDAYFVTSLASPKIGEIAENSAVTVTFQDGSTFASLSGTARVIRDRDLVRRLWTDAWMVWFPNGPDDPGIALIRIDAEYGEYWDNAGVQGVKYMMRAAKAYLRGERPETDESQHAKTPL